MEIGALSAIFTFHTGIVFLLARADLGFWLGGAHVKWKCTGSQIFIILGEPGARGNKSDKEMKRRWFTSKVEKAPGNRLLPDYFQMALPMLPPDWAEKSFVLFCPIDEQQLLRYLWCVLTRRLSHRHTSLVCSSTFCMHARETFL